MVESLALWTEEPEEEPGEDESEEDAKDPCPPEIILSTEPAELVYIEGDPVYTPVADENLMYVSNTDGDVLLELLRRRSVGIWGSRYLRLVGRRLNGQT